MARLPRLALAGQAHLVTLVGRAGQVVFVDDHDRRSFLAALQEVALALRVAVQAYVLDDDHLHLLLTPADDPGLGALMQGLGRRYGAAFNRRHGRSGSLWAGRFRATVVQPGPALLEALLFIDQHPLRNGHAQQPAEQRWCSARAHLGLERQPLLSDCPAWWALGNTPFEREAAYRHLLEEGLSVERAKALGQASRKGWALGDAAFLAEMARLTPRPLGPRPRGRPRRDGVD